jgi:hypothetical protein
MLLSGPSMGEPLNKVIAAWDGWSGASDQATTSAYGCAGMANAVVSGEGSAVSMYQRGGSTDGTWGSVPGADKTDTTFLVESQVQDEPYYIDFTVTASGQMVALSSFHFDAVFSNPSAHRAWALSVESGAVTLGPVAKGQLATERAWQSVDVNLSKLADRVLAVGESVTLRLAWSGGTFEDDRKRFVGVDNVAVKALVAKPAKVSQATAAMRNSDGSYFVPQACYPEFSWDSTPRYFMFGDKNRLLKPDQVKFIAGQTGFICIEKSHGMDPLGAAELGAKHEAAALKKVNPKVKVLFYFNAAYAWPYTSYNKGFTKDALENSSKLRAFFVYHPKTGKLTDRYGAFCFDVLNPEFRDWWVKTVAKGVRDSGCDGAFIDQMHGNVDFRKSKKSEIEKAMGEMMAALKKELGPDKILLANNAYSDNAKYVYPVSDAIMFENNAREKSSKESLLNEWDEMLRNAKEGKISVFRLGVEGTWRAHMQPDMAKLSQEKVEFSLACYLIGAQPYSYFMYSWGWKLASGALVEYPEFKKPLGPPKGAYKRTTPDGWEFTREFEHASVWVNTETRKAKITWK